MLQLGDQHVLWHLELQFLQNPIAGIETHPTWLGRQGNVEGVELLVHTQREGAGLPLRSAFGRGPRSDLALWQGKEQCHWHIEQRGFDAMLYTRLLLLPDGYRGDTGSVIPG